MDPKTQEILNELRNGITAEVLTKLKADLPALRKDIFGSESKNEDAKMAKAVSFVKALATRDLSTLKGMSEGTPADGGFLAPEEFASEIIRVIPKYGFVRRNARVWPMTKLTQNIPSASGVVAYRVGESSKGTSSKPTIARTILTAQKVVAMVPVSNELLEDANVDVVTLIATLGAEAFGKLEDQWGLLGLTGTEGIFRNAYVPVYTLSSGNTDYTDMEPDDLALGLNLLDEDAVANAKFVSSFSVQNSLRLKKSSAGGYLFPPPTAGMLPSLWNVPSDTSRVMPHTSDVSQEGTKFAIAGDFSKLILGDRKTISMEISREATVTDTDGSTPINAFEQDMSIVKLVERIDLEVAEADKAFVSYKTAAS